MIKKWSMSYPAVNGTEQRRAYVYLPTMYEAQPELRFPVLYMFDGQNVFFNEDATYGKSWGVADYLDYTDTPLIVAAIECNAGANNERLVEYSPYRFDDPTYDHELVHPPVQAFDRPKFPHPAGQGTYLYRRQQHGRADEPVRSAAI